MTARLRYALVVLAVLPLLLSGANLLFTTHEVGASDHKFCQVITGFTAVPVAKPADAAANPSRENDYEWYERFAALGRSLGC